MNFTDFLLQGARRHPDAVAIVEGDRPIRFDALEHGVLAVEAALRDAGLGPGTVVGLASKHVSVHLILTLAVARLGGTTMPMPSGPTLAERLAPLRRAGASVLIGERTMRDGEDAAFEGLRYIAADESLLAGRTSAKPGARGEDVGDRPWRLTATSGTTGAPKLIAISHERALTLYMLQQGFLPFGGPGTRLFCAIGLDVPFGLNHCLRQLMFGGAVVAYSDRIDEAIDVCERHAVTHLIASPSTASRWLARLPDSGPRLPAMRVYLGGGAVSPALRDALSRRLSPRVGVLYGASEYGGVAVADEHTLAEHPDSVGRVLPWLQVEAIDGQGRPVPPGDVGEIRVQGLAGFPGYHDDPAATAASLRDGWFHPGDLGRVTPDGLLFIDGRVDDVINVGGIKVLPARIEAVLEAHPDVAEAAAFAASGPDGTQVLLAAVVCRGLFDEAALLAHCRAQLGAMAPQRLKRLQALPRNASGKLVRRILSDGIRLERPPAAPPAPPGAPA